MRSQAERSRETNRLLAEAARDVQLAAVPSPERHASLAWQVESGSPERTRAMMRSLGLTALRDLLREDGPCP